MRAPHNQLQPARQTRYGKNARCVGRISKIPRTTRTEWKKKTAHKPNEANSKFNSLDFVYLFLVVLLAAVTFCWMNLPIVSNTYDFFCFGNVVRTKQCWIFFTLVRFTNRTNTKLFLISSFFVCHRSTDYIRWLWLCEEKDSIFFFVPQKHPNRCLFYFFLLLLFGVWFFFRFRCWFSARHNRKSVFLSIWLVAQKSECDDNKQQN